MDNKQVKSRKRVVEHGEVFTNEREINSMLDMVKDETERIESRFLEPACGDGNFLIKVLERKLNKLVKLYSKNKYEFEKYSFIAVSSLYGVDILQDNVLECRIRLSTYVEKTYKQVFSNTNQNFMTIIAFVLQKNIVCGDALTMLKVDSKEPIVFSEWSMVSKGKVKRRDYTLAELLEMSPQSKDEVNLFSDLGDEVFVPTPCKEYPLVDFMEITKYD